MNTDAARGYAELRSYASQHYKILIPGSYFKYSQIFCNPDIPGPVLVSLLNYSGILLYSVKKNRMTTGETQLEIHAGSLTAGLYLICCSAGERIETKRICIQ